MRRSSFHAAVVAAAALLSPLAASAGSIYLNGVKIDGVTNQTFERCKVTIDASGNILISAPGYQVQQPVGVAAPVPAPPVAPAPTLMAAPPGSNAPTVVQPQGVAPAAAAATAAAAPTGALTRRYWLVSYRSPEGEAQFDVDLFINSRWLRKFRSAEEQVVLEITDRLKPGPNQVLFLARKDIAAGRKSWAPGHFLKLIVGEGQAGGDKVMIDNPLYEYTKTAAESEDASTEWTLQAR